ncbi:MAG TPA: xanthine dehydrogenase family protein molybdopterin-binding subunit [Xanthobacteraceae bacterium]|nr:xanthine dehydrogenase family protein molybdopterin-binding subunit [Xanthobacteraceae bacterium]
MNFRFIGKSRPRTEDLRLVRGLGRFVADLAPADAARLVMVRSPHAAARIVSIDVSAASRLPGVRLILTGESPQIAGLGTFTSKLKRRAPDGAPNFEPPYRALARGRVQFVGDPVAAVIADTVAQAKDAAEAVQVTWEPLPAITETRRAADPAAPQVWPQAPHNICFVFDAGNEAAVEEAFRRAAHTVSLTYSVSRVTAAPMETRGALASYDPATESWTLVVPVQNPHAVREEVADNVLRVDGNRVRVISPDVGGGFGLKEVAGPEAIVALVAARALNRPVLWLAERSEAFTSDFHARDNVSTARLALDEEGRFLALRVDTTANLGAYLSLNGLNSSTNNLGGLSGVYRTPAIFTRVTGVFTNTQPTAPYRGAGRPEATYAIERMIDVAARRLGADPVELRRKNMIAPSEMPYDTGFLFTYDSGAFARNMDEALALADWAGFPKRRKEAASRGKLRGIGLSNPIEIAAGPVTGPLSESAEIRFDSTGSVTVTVGTHSHGQGHETSFAQVVADLIGVDPADVRLRYGDTDLIEHGTGSFGSRSAVAGSVVLVKAADRLIERGRRIAAAHLEAAADDLIFEDGTFRVAGTDRQITIKEVARLAYTLPPAELGGELGLSAKTMVAPARPTFPNGCHVCEVEIDRETGACAVVRYTVVDDVGRIINPLLVEGQIHGGVVQGLGQVLGEAIVYDENGQILSGSFMDYAMPRARDCPAFVCRNNEVLTPVNPLGVKGAGEAGTVGALAAIVNAAADALSGLGIDHVDMPLTSERLWRAIREAEAKSGRASVRNFHAA